MVINTSKLYEITKRLYTWYNLPTYRGGFNLKTLYSAMNNHVSKIELDEYKYQLFKLDLIKIGTDYEDTPAYVINIDRVKEFLDKVKV